MAAVSAVAFLRLSQYLHGFQKLPQSRAQRLIFDLSSMEKELVPIGKATASKAEVESGTDRQGSR